MKNLLVQQEIKINNQIKKDFLFLNKDLETFQINNRRYLGSKTKVLDFIYSVIKDYLDEINVVADIFAGTGVVADMFNNLNKTVIVNDILRSNYVCYNTWFDNQKVNINKIKTIINELNELQTNRDNYVSINFANKYFSLNNARKIGAIREKIEHYDLNNREKDILLTSLLYAIDKIAHTTGHYDAFIKKQIPDKQLRLLLPDFKNNHHKNNQIYCLDANKLIKMIKADLVYIDTPYNSRQYSSAYHLLENIITWNKPKVEGIASKMIDRKSKSSTYCTNKAYDSFKDLINNIKSKFILVSFNNTESKANSRSNSKISKEQIVEILTSKGELFIYELDYKPYSTGKTNLKNHKEILYFCKVNE
ncbi:DNA adenine methylase [Mycoplasma feriruminatoris]|uniref:DNA methyltransferase n=1 Tax=Mycoplasma feriruminatoris TaxID=1179777 RepID=A0AAQ3HWX1_9MOLU|nr:DNA adenine methylase [Mycoplasma feriruminatoris]WFQ95487.1 DNA methyltransferase [Mycoplasma feriruminatoris]